MNRTNCLSIIIVNWNTREKLRECLRSLRELANQSQVVVYVVDNNSADGSAAMVKTEFGEVNLIQSGGNIGFARANNRAVRECLTKYVVFLNPDTVVYSDAFEKMVDFMEQHPDVGAMGCRMLFPDGGIQPLGLQWYPTPLTELVGLLFLTKKTIPILRRFLPYVDPSRSGPVKKLYGGCLLVRKKVLDTVGLFDERFFMYAEDVDLSRRIVHAGWKMHYLADARVIHYCGEASKSGPGSFAVLMMCESIGKYMGKHYSVPGVLAYRLAALVGSGIRMCGALLIFALTAVPHVMAPGKVRLLATRYLRKHWMIILWSLCLRRPQLP